MNEKQNIEIVRSGYEAFGNGDLPGLLGLFDEKIDWQLPVIEGSPYRKNYSGRNEVGEFFALLDETENFNRFEPREFFARGDKVVVLGTINATVNATGRDYTSDWVHVFTLRDEKIVAFQEYFENLGISKAFQKAATAG